MGIHLERHPFLEDLNEGVTLVSSVLRCSVSGRENVLRVVNAGASQYLNQTATALHDIGDRRYFEYKVELEGGLNADGLVAIERDQDGGVTHLTITFSPLDAVLSLSKGMRSRLAEYFDDDVFI